jgi:hypothetical protein
MPAAGSALERSTRLRGVLVGEFALALVLLVGAALLVQSFGGFNTSIWGSTRLSSRRGSGCRNDPRSGPYFTHPYQRVLDRVAALPGVKAAGGVTSLPLGGTPGRAAFSIEGRAPEAGNVPVSEVSLVTPGYFAALGIALVQGRLLDDHDDIRAPSAVVVSESFARQFFLTEDPIGKRIAPGGARPPGAPAQPPNWLTIVGVVRDVKSARLEAAPAPAMYRSVLQISNLNLTLAVRTTQDPAEAAFPPVTTPTNQSRCSACGPWTRWCPRRWPSGASRCCCSRYSRRPRSRCRRSASMG